MRIAYYLPEKTLDNSELVKVYPDWTEEKIYRKTGIRSRHVVDGEDAVDIAERACLKLFENGLDRSLVDFIILCTQSPRYKLPSSACILQDRLGLSKSIGALDYDLGCSGFVYGLSLAKGLIVSGAAKGVLLVTAETYSRYLGADDRTTRTIFGDGAAATFLDAEAVNGIGEFSFGTDGGGSEKLILKDGKPLFMDGPDIFNFTLDVVAPTLNELYARNGLKAEDIDLYVFHQANKFMLDTIRKVNGIASDKFYINMEDTGNTVSSTIPIALARAETEGLLRTGMKVAILGFGVGLSWAGSVLTWR